MEFLELKKIEIISLYHKGNVVLNLDNDCTILIGENGIGKTSALKIAQSIITGDLISVANYIFDEIIITDSEDEHIFTQQDFLIPIKKIEKKFAKECLPEINENEREFLAEQFKMLLSDLLRRGMLGPFLYETYNSHDYSSLINRVIKRYLDPEIINKMVIKVNSINPCYLDAPIFRSKYYSNISEKKYWVRKVVYGDMVEKVHFPEKGDGFVHFSFLSSNEKDLLSAISNDKELDVYTIFDDIGGGEQTSYKIDSYYSSTSLQDVLIPLAKKQSIENVFDIDSAIKALYYFDYTIQDLNEVAIRGTRDFLKRMESEHEYSTNTVEQMLSLPEREMLYVHENYIYPILAEELPFRMNLAQLLTSVKRGLQEHRIKDYKKECALLESYLKIYEELKEIVLDGDAPTDAIVAFQDLITQYIDDKVICVTPRGINVYLKQDQSIKYVTRAYDDLMTGVWQEDEIIFGDVDTEMSINNLSSGECKIIMLAFYALFADNDFLIMDEPELSISILWQEKLIRDLLDYGQFKSIIVATHSPYIARDDSLSEFIEYIP